MSDASALHDYRLYLLDFQGRIRAARDLQATSDDGALWQASRLELAQPAELWRRADVLLRWTRAVSTGPNQHFAAGTFR